MSKEWQNQTLSYIFQVSLDPLAAKEHEYVYISSLRQELEQEGNTQFLLTIDLLERLIIARLSLIPQETNHFSLGMTNFDYLLGCWRRVIEASGKTTKELELKILQAAHRFALSYSSIVLRFPDMFPQPNFQEEDFQLDRLLMPLLLADSYSDLALPPRYWQELVNLLKEEDALAEIINPLLKALSQNCLKTQALDKNYINHFRVLNDFINNPSILDLIIQQEIPSDLPAARFEYDTFLGPYLRMSLFPPEKIADSFIDVASLSSGLPMTSAINSLHGIFRNYHQQLFTLMNGLIRKSPKARQWFLDYLALIAVKNVKRSQMRINREEVSSDGFITNIYALLLQFCDPFLDAGFSKIDRIDVDYIKNPACLVEVKSETKINASEEEANVYYSNATDSIPNFISHCFYLTFAFHHIGPHRLLATFEHMQRVLGEEEDNLNYLQQMIQSNNMLPGMEILREQRQKGINQLKKSLVIYEAVLTESVMHNQSLRLASLMMAWLLRLVDPSAKYPKQQLVLPLSTQVPQRFAMLPEYFIEDAVEVFSQTLRMNPPVCLQISMEDAVTFSMTFLSSKEYVKNPYLRAKMVDLLYLIVFTSKRSPLLQPLGILLETHPFAQRYLISSLCRFYIDVEQTGANTQFYDKFNIRYNISQIIKFIWKSPQHRKNLQVLVQQDNALFVKLVNLLMNDTTYLLDEGITKLREIHTIEVEMADTAGWEAKPLQLRQERQGLLGTLERQTTSYIQLANEDVHLLNLMTREIKSPFFASEIIDRLAAMLNYNLASLTGPKCVELKVKDPKKYYFQPRRLLQEIVEIYLNLDDREAFAAALGRDGRSFNEALFHRAGRILDKYQLIDYSSLERLYALAKRAEASREQDEADDEDVPEDFLDALLYTVMKDPVILPSGKVVDIATIKAHLLSDPTDPFNRQPLSLEQVIPDEALKKAIIEWRQQRRNNDA